MALPLLQSKLFVPVIRSACVLRPRLLAKLDEGLQRKLTLISAPAGFGKTTLVSAWLAQSRRPAAWLALDAGDSDPIRFLTYLVGALQTLPTADAAGRPPLGAGLLEALQSPQPPPPEVILTALLNQIAAAGGNFVLVLDDYHVIDAAPVDSALALLVEHLPPSMHLVITTREDPRLPLPRLRARGQLAELRAADLRFTAAEAAEFLNQVMGLQLAAEETTALEQRTEGWIAGLQLAALSMQGRDDRSGFVRAFAGDHRYIVDYLVEEVLASQPEAVRSFLLQTSILDRLHGALCDAVTGQAGGGPRLEALERGNFFVTPLDDKREWYRYHHLFGEVLCAHLAAEQPGQLANLHRRASAWYEQHGFATDAIRHALAAADFARTADLVERALPAVRKNRQEATLLSWLQALPDELLRDRTLLCVAYAHVLLATGQAGGVEARLRMAELGLDGRDEAARRSMVGAIAIARAGLALASGNVAGTMAYAQQALDVAPEDDYQTRGGAAGFLGLALWANGELEEAHRVYAGGMATLQAAGNLVDAVAGAANLGAIRLAQGRLRAALRTYEDGLALATARGEPVLRGAADMHVGIGEILRERNELAAAREHLLRCQQWGEHTGFVQHPYHWRVVLARIHEAEGDLDGALALLDAAAGLQRMDFAPDVRPLAALKARVWLAQGRVDDARAWAHARGLSATDDLGYAREFEHITLARILLAQARREHAGRAPDELARLLGRLLQAAAAGERTASVIEILLLQALAAPVQAGGKAPDPAPAALAPLARALALAEPEGYVRIFVDEGARVTLLLGVAVQQGIAPDYARSLLAAFGKGDERVDAKPAPPAPPPLLEPLSERELDVLRLLAGDLTGPQLARALVISLSTLRTHTQNIYGKLGVNSRRAAVRRAQDLALL